MKKVKLLKDIIHFYPNTANPPHKPLCQSSYRESNQEPIRLSSQSPRQTGVVSHHLKSKDEAHKQYVESLLRQLKSSEFGKVKRTRIVNPSSRFVLSRDNL